MCVRMYVSVYTCLNKIAMLFIFKHLHETLGIQPGEARLFLNGLHIDLDFHDPFR